MGDGKSVARSNRTTGQPLYTIRGSRGGDGSAAAESGRPAEIGSGNDKANCRTLRTEGEEFESHTVPKSPCRRSLSESVNVHFALFPRGW